MLFQDDILFYNVSELIPAQSYPGLLLSRFPQTLIDQMDMPQPAQFSRGCELRFWQLPNTAPTTINLYAFDGDGQAVVLFGEHYAKEFRLEQGKITPLELSMDPLFAKHLALDEMAQTAQANSNLVGQTGATEQACTNQRETLRYPSTLCRVFLNNEAKVAYCGKGELTAAQLAQFAQFSDRGVPLAPKCHTLQGVPMAFPYIFNADGTRNLANDPAATPPPSAVPPYHAATPPVGVQAMQAGKKFIAYGSSITHGVAASSNYLSYLQLTAKNLNCDALNFGMSGSCTCDNAMADYIAAVPDIDFYFLELGVNMRHRYYLEEFEARLVYLLQKLQGRKVYITTLYPNRATYLEVENKLSAQEREFNALIRKYAPQYGAVLLEGADVLQSPLSLTHDFIHPSPMGHIKMAETLTQMLWQERNV